MTVSELYHRLCPNCREMFTCVSSAGRYCSDKCRNQAYRRRKAMEKDGPIHTVPKLYNVAIHQIQLRSPSAYQMIERMQLYGASSWALKAASFAAYMCTLDGDGYYQSEYIDQLRADLEKRHQQEIFKYVSFEEASR